MTLRDEPPLLLRGVNAEFLDRRFNGTLFVGRFNRTKECCRASARSIDAPTVRLLGRG
jgi:hypothetical protein